MYDSAKKLNNYEGKTLMNDDGKWWRIRRIKKNISSFFGNFMQSPNPMELLGIYGSLPVYAIALRPRNLLS